MDKYSEWGVYVETSGKVRKYFCTECRLYHGLMRVRTCTNSDNNVHREYKIVCEKCGKTGTLHWSKNLAEHSWKAINPNLNEDYISQDVSEFNKKVVPK